MSYSGAQAMYQRMLAKKQAAAAAASGGDAQPADGGAPSSNAEPAKPTAIASPPVVTAPEDGVVVIFGGTNFRELGSGKEAHLAPNLFGPHRLLAGLGGVKIGRVASGCASSS